MVTALRLAHYTQAFGLLLQAAAVRALGGSLAQMWTLVGACAGMVACDL